MIKRIGLGWRFGRQFSSHMRVGTDWSKRECGVCGGFGIEFIGKMKSGRCVWMSTTCVAGFRGGVSAWVAPAIYDRVAAVQPERTFGQARAGGGLEAFVFADVDQVFDFFRDGAVETLGGAIFD